MKYLAALALLAAMMGACAQSVTRSSRTDAVTDKSSPALENISKEPGKNECKICEYDFQSYTGELEKKEVEGLFLALNDEYLATEIYKGVNMQFDDPRPFVNIVRAEEQHTGKLIELFKKYDLPVPDNPWPGQVPAYDSVRAACEAGVEAEIVNRDLYSRLNQTTRRADILEVYGNLQRASEENHKPAFERCAEGGDGGPGNSPRGGRRADR